MGRARLLRALGGDRSRPGRDRVVVAARADGVLRGGRLVSPGGDTPYGYRSLGELSVFLFFGPIAVCGTVFIQLGFIPWLALVASFPSGLLVCALLVTNNLRDIPTDTAAGKITLAVKLGEPRTRVLYVLFVAATFASGLALVGVRPWVLLVLAAAPFGSFRYVGC